VPEPKYSVIAADIAGKIRSGELPAGSRLPSIRELRHQYAVSETVIRFVMVDLKARGLVEGEPGRAVFVLPRK